MVLAVLGRIVAISTCPPAVPKGQKWLDNNGSSFSEETVPRLGNIAMVSSPSYAIDFGLCFHNLKLNCGPGCLREDNCNFNLPPCGARVAPGKLGSDPAKQQ